MIKYGIECFSDFVIVADENRTVQANKHRIRQFCGAYSAPLYIDVSRNTLVGYENQQIDGRQIQWESEQSDVRDDNIKIWIGKLCLV